MPATPGCRAIANAASTPAADSIRQWSRRGRAEREHASTSATLDLRDVDAGDRRAPRPPRGRPVGSCRRVDAHVARACRAARRAARARSARACGLRGGRDAVLEVDDHRVRARRRSPSRRGRAGRPGRRARSAAGRSDDPLRAQARELVRRRRRARRGRRRCRRRGAPPAMADLARRLREAADDVRHPQRAELGVLDGRDRAERRELRIGERRRARRRSARSPPRPARTRRAPRRAARSAIHAATASSTSSTCAARPAPVANHGSSTRSGRPTSRMTRSAIEVALAETATQRPSAVRYTLRGALWLERLPVRGCSSPSSVVRGDLRAEQRHQRLDQRRVDDLAAAGRLARAQRDEDGERGRERRRRRRRARAAAAAAARPARRSARRSRSSPPRACRSPAARRTGPVWPKPVTRASTSRGFAAESSSQPSPQRSSVPGRKFSSTTSARSASRRKSVAPVGLREVERDEPLVARERLEPEPVAVLARPVPARGIGPARVLELDHVRAEVAEQHPGERRREQRRRLDDPDPVERPRGHGGRPPAGSRSRDEPLRAGAGEQQLERVARAPARRRRRTSPSPRPPVRAALEDREARAAVAVLALRPVPDERRGALEQARLGGELPLVLGRQPRADARPRTRAPRRGRARSAARRRRSATSRTRDREARRRDRVALAPRRGRAGAAAAASTPRRTAPRRRCRSRGGGRPAVDAAAGAGASTKPVRDARRARATGAGDAHRLARRERRRRRRRATITCSAADERRDAAAPGASTSKLAAPVAGDTPSPRFATAQSVVSPSLQRDATTRASAARTPRAASTRRSRAAARSRRCTAQHRAQQRLVALAPADPRAEDVLPDEHPDAVQPGAVQLLGVARGSSGACGGACAAARTSCARSTPGTALSANHCAHERWWSQIRASGSVDSPSSATSGPTRRRAQRRAAPPSSCRGRRRRRRARARARAIAVVVGDRLAPRADVPRVVVDEHADAARRGARRRARAGRARRGRSRTGCARRSRSPGRRARARRRRSRRTRARPRRRSGRA